MNTFTRLGPYTGVAQKTVLDALIPDDAEPGPTWMELAAAFVVLLLGALGRTSPDEDQDPEPETKPAVVLATHAEVADGLALRTRTDFEAQDEAWRAHLRETADPRRPLALSHAGRNLGAACPLPGGRWKLEPAPPAAAHWGMSFATLADVLNYVAHDHRDELLVEPKHDEPNQDER